jgi:phosphopantothenoylcysteine synthetase/decarboxylase
MRILFCAGALSSVMSRNPQTEANLQHAKPRGHERIAPIGWREKGNRSKTHESQPHDRNHPD